MRAPVEKCHFIMNPNIDSRILRSRRGLFAILVLFTCATQLTPVHADDTPTTETGPVEHAPPPALPVMFRPPTPERPSPRPQGPTRYSIGDPTDEEQLYLEHINRSRSNPPAEGVRL